MDQKHFCERRDHGTVIKADAESDGNIIRGISSINNIALLSLEGSGMVGVPGFSKRLFESLSGASINVILITQGSSEHSICVGVDAVDAEKAKQVIDQAFTDEITMLRVEPLIVEKDLSIVALVGDHMKSHPGFSGKMLTFRTRSTTGMALHVITDKRHDRKIFFHDQWLYTQHCYFIGKCLVNDLFCFFRIDRIHSNANRVLRRTLCNKDHINGSPGKRLKQSF